MHKHFQLGQRLVHRRLVSPLLFTIVVIILGLGLACGRATEKPTAASSTATNNDPDQILRQMSEKLVRAQMLTFKVDRKLDAALVEGRNLAESTQVDVSISRPGKFLAKSASEDNVRHLVFDGQNFSIYDETMKLYATVPLPGTIDDLVAKVDEKYGFTPPLAEFIVSDPYVALGPEIRTKAYNGKETVNGVECHHLTLGGDVADSELWIGVADLLPYKLVATFKNRDGGPKFQADFSNWNLAAAVDDKAFVFAPPQDAEKVEMVTEAQMNEAAEKDQQN